MENNQKKITKDKKKLTLILIIISGVLLIIGVIITARVIKPVSNSSINEGGFDQISKVNSSIQELKQSDVFLNSDPNTMTQLVLKELEKQAKEGRIDEESIFCDEDEHVITF